MVRKWVLHGGQPKLSCPCHPADVGAHSHACDGASADLGNWLLVMLLQVAVVLSEKVDTTLSKGVLRIGGTVVGGSLGEHMTAPDPDLAHHCRRCHHQSSGTVTRPYKAALGMADRND